MKVLKNAVVVMSLSLVWALPLAGTGMASAQLEQTSLRCNYPEYVEYEAIGTVGCDMALTKQVSVNGGAYNDADTLDQATQATVGDTVTWKVTVTNTSEEGYTPYGAITVHDVVPTGFTVSGTTPSAGTFSDGDWNFVAEDNLPATLLITGTVTTAGSIENTATLTGYDPCEGDCEDPPYVDSNNTNNANSAFVKVSAKPVVHVNTPAAPQTGFGVAQANTGLSLSIFLALAAALVTAARAVRSYAQRSQSNS